MLTAFGGNNKVQRAFITGKDLSWSYFFTYEITHRTRTFPQFCIKKASNQLCQKRSEFERCRMQTSSRSYHLGCRSCYCSKHQALYDAELQLSVTNGPLDDTLVAVLAVRRCWPTQLSSVTEWLRCLVSAADTSWHGNASDEFWSSLSSALWAVNTIQNYDSHATNILYIRAIHKRRPQNSGIFLPPSLHIHLCPLLPDHSPLWTSTSYGHTSTQCPCHQIPVSIVSTACCTCYILT